MNIDEFATDLFNRMNAAHDEHDFNAPPDYNEWLADQRDYPEGYPHSMYFDEEDLVDDDIWAGSEWRWNERRKQIGVPVKQAHLCRECGGWYMGYPCYYDWGVCDDCSPF